MIPIGHIAREAVHEHQFDIIVGQPFGYNKHEMPDAADLVFFSRIYWTFSTNLQGLESVEPFSFARLGPVEGWDQTPLVPLPAIGF